MVSRFVFPMTDVYSGRKLGKLPTLRRYLLFWFAGCAIVMVVAYTELLDYYLDLGIDLKTQSSLERTAQEYAQRHGQALHEGGTAVLPAGRNLTGYLAMEDIPAQIRAVFPLDELVDGEVLRFVNLDLNDDDNEVPVDATGLCQEGNCELIFLYPFRLNEAERLFLIQGIVASDATYDELELTEQVAFGIGSLFTVLFLFVAFLGIRGIDAPLRKLERWSESLSDEDTDQTVPDLRFQEFDLLANRLQYAFERMREGVEKEKLFLRHASHELRTPIAILSANLELIDRLRDQAERSEAEQASFLRQYRAIDDVQQLMETLLWINRRSDNLPPSEDIDLRREVDSIVENYRYLLENKEVVLAVEGCDEVVSAPVAAVRIILSNLIRNAFQYTVDGEVRITVDPSLVRIENANIIEVEPVEAMQSDDDYGFGLGLELVDLICKRFGWRCTSSEQPGGRITVIQF